MTVAGIPRRTRHAIACSSYFTASFDFFSVSDGGTEVFGTLSERGAGFGAGAADGGTGAGAGMGLGAAASFARKAALLPMK